MDALSITASFVALASFATTMLRSLVDNHKLNKPLQDEVLELNVYVDLLLDISRYPVLESRGVPRALESSVRLCHDQLERLVELIEMDSKSSRIKPLASKEVEKAINRFIRSVSLLRDVAMDATTHNVLQEQNVSYHHRLMEMNVHLIQEIDHLRAQVDLIRQGLSLDSEQHRTGLNDLADRLRSITENNVSRTADWRPDTVNQFSFTAKILNTRVEESDLTVARGHFDTACDDNWISMEVLQRAGIDDRLSSSEIQHSYVAFGGQEFEPIGKIKITWYADNAGMSRETTFLVHHEVPFDMVLGRTFIAEESIFVFRKPALALRMGKFTKEEHRIIEENARKKGATNDQISAFRRAEEASARDRLREQKAASTVASSLNSPCNQSTISLVSTRLLSPDTVRQPRQVTSASGGSVSTQPNESE